MIVVRSVVTGVKQHFAIRLSEWMMLLPAFGMFIALRYIQPDMFNQSKSFADLQRWADEQTWATLVLFVGVVRLGALVVNGTFDTFRWSPHIRATAAIFGFLFWLQFVVGIYNAYITVNASISGVFAYGTLMVYEIANIYRSARDIGLTYAEVRKRHRNGLGV